MGKVTRIESKKIVNVFFPTDGGRWTDPMISEFTMQLSGVGLPIRFTNLGWAHPGDTLPLLEEIEALQPDVVFLPDDFLYLSLAAAIELRAKNALVVYIAFYTDKSLLTAAKNQTGVYCNAPVDHLLQRVQSISPIKSIGIVGGPFADKLIDRVVEKIGGTVTIERFTTPSWDAYASKLKAFGEKYDAVWPLATFGVKNTDGSPVTEAAANALVEEVTKISLGYGRISGFHRTVDMDVDPSYLGRNAAALVFKYLKGEKVAPVEEFSSYALRISDSHLKRLHLTVPADLQGFISLRD